MYKYKFLPKIFITKIKIQSVFILKQNLYLRKQKKGAIPKRHSTSVK